MQSINFCTYTTSALKQEMHKKCTVLKTIYLLQVVSFINICQILHSSAVMNVMLNYGSGGHQCSDNKHIINRLVTVAAWWENE